MKICGVYLFATGEYDQHATCTIQHSTELVARNFSNDF
jgi:hypothetical protein